MTNTAGHFYTLCKIQGNQNPLKKQHWLFKHTQMQTLVLSVFYSKKNGPRRPNICPLMYKNKFTDRQGIKKKNPFRLNRCAVWHLKLVSIRTCSHTRTHTHLYRNIDKAPEIHSCQEAHLNSKSVVFYNRQSRISANAPFVKQSLEHLCFLWKSSRLSSNLSGVSRLSLKVKNISLFFLSKDFPLFFTWGQTGTSSLFKGWENRES